MSLWAYIAQVATPTATAVSMPVPADGGGGGGLDAGTIITWVALIVGLMAGVVQVVDYLQKQQENRRAKQAAEQEATLQTIPQPPTPDAQLPQGPPNNLPEQTKPLVGRGKELEATTELLRSEEVRLLTFTGPGGTGKTRLSLETAGALLEDFEDGVYFIPLASISDHTLVVSTIAQALKVKEADDRPLLENLKEHLRNKQMLVLLDNFEQVVEAAPAVAELLAAAPRLKVIVTSRSVLRITREHEFPVPPLELPDPKRLPRLEVLSKYESVALFVQRAQVVKPYFALTNENAPAVAEICVRLDGLPLAIELAAARVKMLTPQAMLERLSSRLQLLTGGARDLPGRQQTLRGAIDWSHDLLEKDEQALFRRVAVFVNGCTLTAAEAVCGAGVEGWGLGVGESSSPTPNPQPPTPASVLDGLGSLVDKSLLRQETEEDGGIRFWMLATIREYALERLTTGDEEGEIRRRHAEYYGALAEEADPKLRGPEQRLWLERLETEHDNFRAALEWSQTPVGNPDLGLQLAGALGWFWQVRGHVTEGRARLAEALARPEVADRTPVRARALTAAGRLAFVQCDFDAARASHEQSLEIGREVGDNTGIALSYNNLGHVAYNQGDYDASRRFYEEGLALRRELGDKRGIAQSLNNLGIVAKGQGDYENARKLYAESLSMLRELGDKMGVAQSLNNLGNVAFAQGDYAEARGLFEESLVLERELKSKEGMAYELGNVGKVALRQGDHNRARELFEESLSLRVELGDKVGISKCLAGLAAATTAGGKPEQGAQLLAASDALLGAIGAQLDPADRTEYERYVEAARDSLGKEAFDKAWEQGRAMDMEQAVDSVKRET